MTHILSLPKFQSIIASRFSDVLVQRCAPCCLLCNHWALVTTMRLFPCVLAGLGLIASAISSSRHPGTTSRLPTPLAAVIVFRPPAGGSNASSTLSTDAPPVFNVGLLLNPPKTSVDSWVAVRNIVLTGDTVWPSPQQLAAQVATVGGRLSTSSTGAQVSGAPAMTAGLQVACQ
jgi:hypothetical protein